ncbi:hypothetical protein THAOC_09148 [Thalassiosira oceanica]|uniref:Uncharacterized protein n=1 Tax=Thalassiosira oceanica TaxID=159749 RepID=K0SVX7_THAOC|nr:hypothetical protein THAOC_09148 [Thalassiosira oceanica]|eukprot:EJK69580.1 hypothetical protein THAOC_09148 [Thalassiosira oceanica]
MGLHSFQAVRERTITRLNTTGFSKIHPTIKVFLSQDVTLLACLPVRYCASLFNLDNPLASHVQDAYESMSAEALGGVNEAQATAGIGNDVLADLRCAPC